MFDANTAALDFLYRDEARNFRMIDIVRRYPSCFVLAEPQDAPEAVAVSSDGVEEWHIAAARSGPLESVLDALPEAPFDCWIHQGCIFDRLERRYALTRRPAVMAMTASADTFRPRPHPDVAKMTHDHIDALIASAIWPDRSAIVEQILTALAAFVVVRDGRVVAKADAQERSERYCEINEVVVVPDHRRQGLGAGVATAAAQWILDGGRTPVYGASAQDRPAVTLAEGLGFRCACSHMRYRTTPKRTGASDSSRLGGGRPTRWSCRSAALGRRTLREKDFFNTPPLIPSFPSATPAARRPRASLPRRSR